MNEIMVIMPQEELSQIKSDIRLIMDKLSSKNEESFSDQFICSTKVPKLLSISSRTWQNYRDKKKIPFIQIGYKIWVKRKDLESFFDKYYIKP